MSCLRLRQHRIGAAIPLPSTGSWASRRHGGANVPRPGIGAANADGGSSGPSGLPDSGRDCHRAARDGLVEQIALEVGAGGLHLCLGLHAFRHHAHPERHAETDDGLYDFQ